MFIRNFLLSLLALFLISTPVFAADAECQPIFGGGQSCQTSNTFVVATTVQNPENKAFVKQLGSKTSPIAPINTLTIRIIVTNNSNNPLKNIAVKAKLPKAVTSVTTKGTYDPKTNIFSYTIANLNANASSQTTLNAQIAPQAKGCFTNSISATIDKQISQDASQFCITPSVTSLQNQLPTANPSNTTKGGLSLYPSSNQSQTPASGPETLALFSLIPAMALGFFLQRKTRNI